MGRPKKVTVETPEQVQEATAKAPASSGVTQEQSALAQAFITAIEATRPPVKKTPGNRKKDTPWMPRDGSPRLKMKRKFYHHGVPIESRVSNEEIDLLNKIRPGYYCEGVVKVTLRKDRGIDVDYPVKTASQRLRLVNQFGIRNFAELLKRIIDEHKDPKIYRRPDDMDLFEDVV